jgi:hypothetical protein
MPNAPWSRLIEPAVLVFAARQPKVLFKIEVAPAKLRELFTEPENAAW